jgi:hypothetical protein
MRWAGLACLSAATSGRAQSEYKEEAAIACGFPSFVTQRQLDLQPIFCGSIAIRSSTSAEAEANYYRQLASHAPSVEA